MAWVRFSRLRMESHLGCLQLLCRDSWKRAATVARKASTVVYAKVLQNWHKRCFVVSYPILSITVFVSCLGRWINCVASDHGSPLRWCLVQLSDFLLLCVCLCYGALTWLRISPHIWCFQYLICQKVCKLLCVLSVMLLLRDLLIVTENTWFLCLLDSMNESEVSLLNSVWLYE